MTTKVFLESVVNVKSTRNSESTATSIDTVQAKQQVFIDRPSTSFPFLFLFLISACCQDSFIILFPTVVLITALGRCPIGKLVLQLLEPTYTHYG